MQKKLIPKSNLCSLVNLLEFKGMILTSILIFDKLTTQQLGYFWRPEEVSLQKDRSDYHTLRPEQKHIYTSNLKYQIMLDSVQGRGPGMAFAPYCSLPELEACMKVWEFMEMIHSRSYTYIIKNVYLRPF